MPSQVLSKSSPVPRFATPRPTGPTYGPAICKLMTMLGYDPMPWQEYAADVIGEIDPVTGLRRWGTVIISVPRQSGKTALVTSVCVHATLTGKGKKVWMTAQKGKDARERWMETVEKIESPSFPLRSLFTSRKSQGSEALKIPRLGSTFSPFAPTDDALHGTQSDLTFIDEAWVFDEVRGKALIQASQPTEFTRAGAQTIIVSTMGTADSTWFHGLVEKAKLPGSDIAIIDYGIGEDDNPLDIDVVAAHHPAIGYTAGREALVKALGKMEPAEFARAYGNRPTGAKSAFINQEAWKLAQTDERIPDDAEVIFAAAVDDARTETVIVAAAYSPDGVPMIEVVDRRPGTGWAAKRLKELCEKHGAPAPYVDKVSPAGTIYDRLQQMKLEPPKFAPSELAIACAEFVDRITRCDEDGNRKPEIKIIPDDSLNFAAAIAQPRPMSNAWAWERRKVTGSIAPIEAATLALFGLMHRPKPKPKPFIYFRN